jgi:formate hydrogenlyase subunit 6/NADH:ubiquinone oxidoreductase subunit I
MATYFISKDNFSSLLENLQKEYSVFIPVKKGENRYYSKFLSKEQIGEPLKNGQLVLGEVRPFEPLKLFYMRSREIIAEGFKDEVPRAGEKPYCIVGVKACDLKGFKVYDRVFRDDDYKDPFYMKEREENLIIASDCTMAIDTCYCLSLHVNPYPQENFDVNLSELNEGLIVESGSERGESLINLNASLFSEAKGDLISERDAQRKKVSRAVEKNITVNDIPDQDSFNEMIQKSFHSNIWKEEAENCVECGACNMICPTCHCFFMYDQKDSEKLARLRVWDSCMVKDFAKVAGGANPRSQLWMRLRNRFEKKFDFFPKIGEIYACTGCGRCISACPAKIDIRKVLKRLVENV